MSRAAILFSDFGPYHVARIEALGRSLAGEGMELVAFRFTERSDTYGWDPVLPQGMETVTLADRSPAGSAEAGRMAWRFRSELRQRGITAAFLPTYSPLPNLLCLLAAKSAGCRTILMTESWLGTENAGTVGRAAKHVLVRMFDSALVGGTPQRDFVVAYGMPPDKVFTGYDVVDTDFFAARAEEVREAAKKIAQSSVVGVQDGKGAPSEINPSSRRRPSSAKADQVSTLASAITSLGLPSRFFLNLGRFVEKKNLATLVSAYARYVRGATAEPQPSGLSPQASLPALVLVGEGPLRADLERQAWELGLRVVVADPAPVSPFNFQPSTFDKEDRGAVFFYPFQQSDMTPVFFALCEAFILPSLYEEWGLVVNEAMACGVPVIVSTKVGAGFDLVQDDVNGFHFDPLDVAGVADLLAKLAGDSGLVRRCGREGSRIIADWGPGKFGAGGVAALHAAANL
jgi:glycosyltransferase involved in cell wall biosynthesis